MTKPNRSPQVDQVEAARFKLESARMMLERALADDPFIAHHLTRPIVDALLGITRYLKDPDSIPRPPAEAEAAYRAAADHRLNPERIAE